MDFSTARVYIIFIIFPFSLFAQEKKTTHFGDPSKSRGKFITENPRLIKTPIAARENKIGGRKETLAGDGFQLLISNKDKGSDCAR